MFEVIPIPAFRDNYIWLLRRGDHAAVVDPGDAAPVLQVLKSRGLHLDTILVTHHHDDHIGGVRQLLDAYPAQVYAPRQGLYDFAHQAVGEDDRIQLPELELELSVIDTPGHTLDHVVYYGANSLFCGDTLFGCGCGRLFEGSCQQLFDSLHRLAELPPDTLVYCAHEYTLHNIHFARTLDPDNPLLAQREVETERRLERGQASLPSTIGLELATNPFFRCDDVAVASSARGFSTDSSDDPVSVFCTIRNLRNSF